MKTYTAKEAKQNFGELIDASRLEPVLISKNGKPTAVLISKAEYDRFEIMEDRIWAERAEAAAAKGYHSVEDTAKFIEEMLNRADS